MESASRSRQDRDPTAGSQRQGGRRPGLVIALAGACLSGMWGCAEPERRSLSDGELQALSAADAVQSKEAFRNMIGRMMTRVERKVQASTESSPAVLDVLAMSGGGDFGAYGAGFLVGWGMAADPAHRRPDFDAVSGVSTGALLAPFAFLGTDEACRHVEQFYRDPKQDWIKSRGPLFFLPSNPSFMAIRGLERDIRSAVSEEYVQQLAEESKKGKILIISATNLDLGRQHFWDVGGEAEDAVANGRPDRVDRIMMASAAIPAVFPPVELDGALYADGGVTANVFVRLEPHSPDGLIQRWMKAHPGTPLPRVRYWVIINNQLSQAPTTVQRKWPAVMSPSLATAIRSATIAEVRWLAAQADYVNAVYKTDIEVRVTAIPNDWRPKTAGDFLKETMESLSDLGRKMGADPNSWSLWASPSQPGGAPPR
jgi:hypothetical protein